MNEYKIGCKEYVVLIDVLALLLFPFLFGIFLFASEDSSEIVLCCIPLAVCLVIFGGSLIYHMAGIYRMHKALKGTKSFAKVTKTIIEKDRMTSNYVIGFEYVDSYNEKAIGIEYVEEDAFESFKVGDSIPVYINDKYAAFIADEVVKFVKKKEKVEFIDITCEYCGQKINSNDETCPHCGALRLK